MTKLKDQQKQDIRPDAPASKVMLQVVSSLSEKISKGAAPRQILDNLDRLADAMQQRGLEKYADFVIGYRKKLNKKFEGGLLRFLGLGKKVEVVDPAYVQKVIGKLVNQWQQTVPISLQNAVTSLPSRENLYSNAVRALGLQQKTTRNLEEFITDEESADSAQDPVQDKSVSQQPTKPLSPIIGPTLLSESMKFYNDRRPRPLPSFISNKIKQTPYFILENINREYDALLLKANETNKPRVVLDCIDELADMLEEYGVQDRSDPSIGNLKLRVKQFSEYCNAQFKAGTFDIGQIRADFAEVKLPLRKLLKKCGADDLRAPHPEKGPRTSVPTKALPMPVVQAHVSSNQQLAAKNAVAIAVSSQHKSSLNPKMQDDEKQKERSSTPTMRADR